MSILDRYLAPPAPPSAPGDPYADALRKERDRTAVQILASEANPDRAARAAQIARENGVPPFTVEQNIDTFEQREKARKADLIFGLYPKLGKWAQNRDYARQSADDIDGLRDVGRVFDPKEWARVHGSMKTAPDADKSLWGALGGLWANLTGGFDEAVAGLDMAVVDTGATDWINRNILRKNETQVRAQRAFRQTDVMRNAVQAKERIESATPQYDSTTGQAIYSGLTSLARMAPGVAMSVALRNPAPALASAGVQSGLPAYSKYRLRGATPGMAALGGVGEGGVEVVTEILPMGKLVAGFGRLGAGQFLREYLGREMPTEQIATFAQDAIDTAIANPDKTWGEFLAERPSAAYQTAVSVLTSSGVLAGASYIAERTAAGQQAKAQAVAEGMFLDRLSDATAKLKLKDRNPAAVRELVETLAGDGPVQNVYIPAEAIRAFMQSDRYQDGMFDPWSEQIAEAEATGADVVIGVGEFVSELPADAYAALKDDIRLSAGGMSRKEAATFDEAMAEYVADLGVQVEAENATARAAMTARDQVFESVQTALMNTGATPAAARQQAELVTARIATRAARMGRELTGREFSDAIDVRQVLPEGLKPLTRGDDLDIVVAAMRQAKGARTDAQKFGPSLLEFIASRGGINDAGGDIASMGGDKWHRGKPGRRKLIKPSQQGGFLGGGSADGLDTMLQAAMDAGYFPELNANRLMDGGGAEMDTQILLDAIGRELAGDPVYSSENVADGQRSDEVRAAADELSAFLEGEGYDVATMRDADLKAVIQRYAEDRPDALYQPAFHGSPHIFDKFSLSAIGTGEGAQAYGWGLYFASKKEIAQHYRNALASQKISWNGKTHDDYRLEAMMGDAEARVINSALERIGIEKSVTGAISYSKRLASKFPDSGWQETVDWLEAHGNEVSIQSGRLYEVEIPDDGEYMLWDKPLSEQPEKVKAALVAMGELEETLPPPPDDPVIADIIHRALKYAVDTKSHIEAVIDNDSMLYNKAMLHAERAGVDPEGGAGDYVVSLANDYVEAIEAQNLFTGQRLYTSLAKNGQEAASKALHDAGIAGIKYLDGTSRNAGDGSYNYVVFDDNAVSIRAYEQSYMDNPRGRVSFTEGKSVIELFEGRNLSTFIHEMGHVWLEELQADAADPTAPQQVRDDWATIEAWFKSNGHPIRDGVIPVEAHELWARGVERYTMEGKAPSSLLRRAFQAFRSWMLSIYAVVENLRAPISPEVRDVMARLIATDEEIANAAQAQGLSALTGLDELMTEAEASAYARSVTEARDEAYDSLLFKVMAQVRKQRTEEYRTAEKAVRAEVTADVDARREFRALAALRSGPKLDKAWLVERYGDAVLAALPKAVPPIYAEVPTSADQIAEQNGFETGDELVKALIGIENRRKELRASGDKRSVRQSVIDDQVSAIMSDRYADILNDGSIEEEALASVHDERQGELIAYELRQLGRATGKGPLPYRMAKEWAAQKVASSPVREVASKTAMQQYARAAAKAGRDAQDAMLKRDVQAAFDAKQKQMLNNALLAEAKRQADRIEAAVARMDKWARRKTSKTVDQAYLEQAHALLEQVDLRRRSNRAVERAESFEQWANARQAEGFDVVVPPSFAEQIGRRNWTRLTVEELLGLDETVKQVIHLGRLKKTLLDGQEKREFEAVVAEAVAAAGGLDKRPPSDLMEPGWADRAGAAIRGFDAALLKMETVFDWLDGGRSTGVFNRIVFKPIADAQDAKQAMIADYTARLADLLKALPKKQIARWAERVVVPELLNRETGRPFVFTRDQLVSIALNTGNAGNMDKLTGGYGWNSDAVMTALNRELTVEEWRYVQNVWDTIETLWPQIAAMEKRINGVAPEKVEALPIDTSAGTLRGGYFPVVYDPLRDYDTEAQRAKSASLFDAVYTRASTPRGFTKERTGVQRPIHLSLGVVTSHITEVIHDLTHREAIMRADRLLSDKRVMQAVDETLGREVRKQFRPWLQNIANEYAKDRAGSAGIEKFLKAARTNTTFVGMGFRVSTIMLQVAGYSNSFERVGFKWVMGGLAEAVARPVETFNFVLEKSGEVAGRMTSLDRDIRDTAKRLAGKAGILSEAQRFAFHGIGLMDRIVVIPTWMGAYRKALANGMTEAQAIYEGDKAVRQSQGAGSTKDLAAIQTGAGTFGELGKFLTLFYSFMSAQWQRQRTLMRDTGDAVANRRYGDFPALLARAWWLLILPPVLSELLAGRGPDDDEDWGMWAFQRMLVNAVGPIPVVRDIASALDSGFGYKFTPVSSAFETGINTARDVGRVAEGEETKRMTRNALETVGYFTGLVPGQVAASTQFLVDVSYGEQDPQTFGEWWEGLTKGKIKED